MTRQSRSTARSLAQVVVSKAVGLSGGAGKTLVAERQPGDTGAIAQKLSRNCSTVAVAIRCQAKTRQLGTAVAVSKHSDTKISGCKMKGVAAADKDRAQATATRQRM